jgi:hypothetical protein
LQERTIDGAKPITYGLDEESCYAETWTSPAAVCVRRAGPAQSELLSQL